MSVAPFPRAMRVQHPAPAAAAQVRPERAERRPLGQILLEMGAVDPGDLLKAIAMRARQDARLGDIMLTHDWVSEADLMKALSLQWGAALVDLVDQRPDPRLVDALGPEFCLNHGLVPWRRAGGATVIATSRPDLFRALLAELPQELGPFVMALASERDIHTSLLASRQTALIRNAEQRVPLAESARGASGFTGTPLVLLVMASFAVTLLAAPQLLFMGLFIWAVVTLVLTTGLKLAAFISHLRIKAPQQSLTTVSIARLPVVSILVPLFRERDITERLVQRLGRLNYPRELLDILLVVEEEDRLTRNALAEAQLPRWMRVILVPGGPIKTKPRALNFAVNFARGSIIGIYDAEDAPEPDQIHKVVRRFHERGPEVACLQGVLDYYNPRTNWLSRCFTIEYASWFRVMLPGLARLGFVIPLGGTTLFFRRAALDVLGGWDAYNVTEDADLGLRLARYGYRAELIETVTEEEPNCRALPWIKQRSRWLKGYAMTYGVHMRNPRLLWRQLGAKRFFGVQVLFLGTLSQFFMAPVLWSFWLIALGLPHPLNGALPGGALAALAGLFVASEAVNMVVAAWAVRGRKHRHLLPWIPTLQLYFPLGALAAWKAGYEVIARPFYWDKTQHGVYDQTQQAAASSAAGGVAGGTGAPSVSVPILGNIS